MEGIICDGGGGRAELSVVVKHEQPRVRWPSEGSGRTLGIVLEEMNLLVHPRLESDVRVHQPRRERRV